MLGLYLSVCDHRPVVFEVMKPLWCLMSEFYFKVPLWSSVVFSHLATLRLSCGSCSFPPRERTFTLRWRLLPLTRGTDLRSAPGRRAASTFWPHNRNNNPQGLAKHKLKLVMNPAKHQMYILGWSGARWPPALLSSLLILGICCLFKREFVCLNVSR